MPHESRRQTPSARAIAARATGRVIGGAKLETALADASAHSDRALIYELCYGVARRYFTLSDRVDALLTQPLKRKDSDIRGLELRSTDHAARCSGGDSAGARRLTPRLMGHRKRRLV